MENCKKMKKLLKLQKNEKKILKLQKNGKRNKYIALRASYLKKRPTGHINSLDIAPAKHKNEYQ